MFFHSKERATFQVNPLFTNPQLYFADIGAADAPAATTFQTYTRQLIDTDMMASVGIIGKTSAVLPYLSVRANIFIHGREHDLSILPPELREDAALMNHAAKEPGHLLRLYIELFRSVLAGKRYIVVDDVLEALSGPEARRFLDIANSVTGRLGVSVIIFTHDAALIRDNPGNSLSPTPDLTVATQAS